MYLEGGREGRAPRAGGVQPPGALENSASHKHRNLTGYFRGARPSPCGLSRVRFSMHPAGVLRNSTFERTGTWKPIALLLENLTCTL